MVNKTNKGNRNRLRCIKQLRNEGYLVDIVEKTSRFSRNKDLFGLFDLIALGDDGTIRFIQVTSNRPHSHKQFEDFVKRFKFKRYVDVEQWVWIDYKGFQVFKYV